MKTSKSILVLTYWSYQDALIQTYTLPYVKIIAKQLPSNGKIFLVTLDKGNTEIDKELGKFNIHNISFAYKRFGISALIMWIRNLLFLLQLIKKERVTNIHAWCTPAGMIGYLLSLFTGKPLIIDSYEPHAESMVENGTWKKNSLAYKLLFKFEKLQTRRAQYLVATTEGMKQYALEKYGHIKNNFFLKPACVNLDLFSEKNIKSKELMAELGLNGKIVCVYAGKFGGIYLDKEVFDFFKVASGYFGDAFKVLILTSQKPIEIEVLARQSGLDPLCVICKFIPHAQIPDYIGLADFAITPVKPVPTKRFCTPIKDGEYWAVGLPVVITKNISDDSGIIEKNRIGSVLKELNAASYLTSIKEIDAILKSKTRMELYKEIRPIAEEYRNFAIAKAIYKAIYKDY